MSKREDKIDLAKVEAALKRAAQTAVTGSRDAQSGRFTGRQIEVKPRAPVSKQRAKT